MFAVRRSAGVPEPATWVQRMLPASTTCPPVSFSGLALTHSRDDPLRRTLMHRAYPLAAVALLAVSLPAHEVFAQGMKELVGTWTVVSNDTTRADGTRMQPFGAQPVGILIFDSEGRYTLQICSTDRPKFASDNRMQGTP